MTETGTPPPKRSRVEMSQDLSGVANEMVYHASRIELNFEDQEIKTIGTNVFMLSMNLVETRSFKELLDAVLHCKVGLAILGPKGVGKTTSLLYLLYKLREKKPNSVLMWLPPNILGSCSNSWTDYAKSCLKKEGWITTIDWGQTVEKVVFDILLKVKNDEFYLFIDEGGDMSTNLKGVYTIVNYCIQFKKKVVLATTSGQRWLVSKNNYVLAAVCQTELTNFTLLPFTIDEAKEYFHDGIDVKFFADIVNVAGLTPLMLRFFRYVKSEENFLDASKKMNIHIRNLLADMVVAKGDDLNLYHNAIELSLKWLIRASLNSVILLSERSEYLKSYVAQESLTFIVKDFNLAKKMELPIKSSKETSEAKAEISRPGPVTNSKAGAVTYSEAGDVTDVEASDVAEFEDGTAKVFLTYPSSLAMFTRLLLKNVQLKDVMNPTVKGYVLERKFILSPDIRSLAWNVAAMRVSDPSETIEIKFSSIRSADEQNSHRITYVTENQLHFLMPGHPAIDAVFVAEDSTKTKYLVLIQVSLSSYANHDSKHTAICKESKTAKHCKGPILQYYATISKIDISNTMYLYVSPNELMKEGVELDTIFDISSRQTRSTECKPKKSYLVGLLHESSEVARVLKLI